MTDTTRKRRFPDHTSSIEAISTTGTKEIRVPWMDWFEWQSVRLDLFSTDRYDRQHGVDRCAAWRSRGEVPLAVEATALLVEISLEMDEKQPRSEMESRLMLSSVVMRTINGLVDASQKGAYALSVSSLAQKIAIPLWMVDIRHDISHNALPTMPCLRMASAFLLDWLEDNYWSVQTSCLMQSVERMAQCIEEGIMLNESSISEDSWEKTYGSLLTSPMQMQTLLIPLLVFGTQYGAARKRGENALWSSSAVNVGPLFRSVEINEEERTAHETTMKCFVGRLQALWHGFSNALLYQLCQSLKPSSLVPIEYYEQVKYWVQCLNTSSWMKCHGIESFPCIGSILDQWDSWFCAVDDQNDKNSSLDATSVVMRCEIREILHNARGVHRNGTTEGGECEGFMVGTTMFGDSVCYEQGYEQISFEIRYGTEDSIDDGESVEKLMGSLDKLYEGACMEEIQRQSMFEQCCTDGQSPPDTTQQEDKFGTNLDKGADLSHEDVQRLQTEISIW